MKVHCRPAESAGDTGKEGEGEDSGCDGYRGPMYKEAGYKPYIVAAMMFLSKMKDPAAALQALEARGQKRIFNY